jgi:hypothetical protein
MLEKIFFRKYYLTCCKYAIVETACLKHVLYNFHREHMSWNSFQNLDREGEFMEYLNIWLLSQRTVNIMIYMLNVFQTLVEVSGSFVTGWYAD